LVGNKQSLLLSSYSHRQLPTKVGPSAYEGETGKLLPPPPYSRPKKINKPISSNGVGPTGFSALESSSTAKFGVNYFREHQTKEKRKAWQLTLIFL
jgi:hypothetical protein